MPSDYQELSESLQYELERADNLICILEDQVRLLEEQVRSWKGVAADMAADIENGRMWDAVARFEAYSSTED